MREREPVQQKPSLHYMSNAVPCPGASGSKVAYWTARDLTPARRWSRRKPACTCTAESTFVNADFAMHVAMSMSPFGTMRFFDSTTKRLIVIAVGPTHGRDAAVRYFLRGDGMWSCERRFERTGRVSLVDDLGIGARRSEGALEPSNWKTSQVVGVEEDPGSVALALALLSGLRNGPARPKKKQTPPAGPSFPPFHFSPIDPILLTHARRSREWERRRRKKQEGEEREKEAHLPDCESTNLGSYRPTCNPKPDRNKLAPQPPPPLLCRGRP